MARSISSSACSARAGQSFDGKRVIVSGSGNVALHDRELRARSHRLLGPDGYVLDETAIDLALLKEIKEKRRGRVAGLREAACRARPMSPGGASGMCLRCRHAVGDAERTDRAGCPHAGEEQGRRGRRGPHALHAGSRAPVPGGRRAVRAGQGGQRRRRGHQRARDAAERFARLLELRGRRKSGSPAS